MLTNASKIHPRANTTARTRRAVTSVPVPWDICSIPTDLPAGTWTSALPASTSASTIASTFRAAISAPAARDINKMAMIA